MSITINGCGGGAAKGQYVWNKLDAEGGNFVDYVVANNENKYPDGGMQGGYWYERVVEGIDLSGFAGYTKMAVDYITYSSAQVCTTKHTHSLGISPKAGMIVALDEVANNGVTFAMCSVSNTNGVTGNSSMRYRNDTTGLWGTQNGSCAAFSSADINFGNNSWTSYYFSAGVKYLLLTWA